MRAWTRSQWIITIAILALFNALALGSLFVLIADPSEPAHSAAAPPETPISHSQLTPSDVPQPARRVVEMPSPTTLSSPEARPPLIPSPTLQVPVLVDHLNVRGGPGTVYPVLTQVYAGTPVVVVGQDGEGDWVEISLSQGLHGWVAGEFVALPLPALLLPQATGIIPTPTVTATQTPTSTATGTYTATATRTLTPTPSLSPSVTSTATSSPVPTTDQGVRPGTRTRIPTPSPSATATPPGAPTSSALVLGVRSTRQEQGEDGSFLLIGELQNDETVPATDVRVEIALYDTHSRLVERVVVAPMVQTIFPGARAPFALSYPAEVELGGVSIRAFGTPAPGATAWPFHILYQRGRAEGGALYRVDGVVRNEAFAVIGRVRVIVSLYDAAGRLLDAGVCAVTPSTLAGQAEGEFDCPFSAPGKVAHYDVWIEGEAK